MPKKRISFDLRSDKQLKEEKAASKLKEMLAEYRKNPLKQKKGDEK